MALFVYDKKKGSLVPAKCAPRGRSCATWPMASESFASSDAASAKAEQAELAKHGVKMEYDEQLRPIWTGRAHKKAYMRALGYADPDAGYGDAEPIHWDGKRKRERASKTLSDAREALIAKEYRLFGCCVSDI